MDNILIIEDEENLARFLELELKHEKYSKIDIADNGRTGLELALNNDYDAILLDLMLPELNGIEVVRRVRQKKNTPIIIMSARDSVMDRVSGLDYGADDYIVKPFTIELLLARLRAVLRRSRNFNGPSDEESTNDILTAGPIKIRTDDQLVKRGNKVISLTKREYDLLVFLANHKNQMQNRATILENVWNSDTTSDETNVVDVYIRYLRNKIDEPEKKSIIQTVRGRGYVIRD